MVDWEDVRVSAPRLAAQAQAVFDAHRHKTLATLRADGAPRISGIEAAFGEGALWIGMMPGSRKARDLLRDPRCALHSASVDPDDADPSAWTGDAKLSGLAVTVHDEAEVGRALRAMGGGDAAGDAHLFRVDVREVVLTRVGDPADHLVIEFWHHERGLRRVERR